MKKIAFIVFLLPFVSLTQASAATNSLLINGSYHTINDTTKYSVLCSMNLEFSNNGRKLIMSLVDNQVNGVFCVNKEATAYRCEQNAGAGRVICVGEVDTDKKLDFIVANDHRFVDSDSQNIFKFVSATVKKATIYVYDAKISWKFLTDNEVCNLAPGIAKKCIDITKKEIEQYVCPQTLTDALAEGKFLCDSHEDNCRKVHSIAFPEFTTIHGAIKDHGCRGIVAYKKEP